MTMMNMKNIMEAVLGVAVGLAFSACDKVDEADRYIKADMPETGRNVLVEEFTGQFCINCPDGHAIIKNIKDLYGEKVITVGIHAGQLAWDDVKQGGLKTVDGDAYASKWNVLSYPSIVVNHQGSAISNMAQWQDAVQKAMGLDAKASIELEATLTEDGKSVNVSAKMIAEANVSANYQVWLTESGITALQQDMSAAGYNLNYVHNHVYRASVNGVGGEKVSLASGVYTEKSNTMSLDSAWKVKNLAVVAFLYDENGVIQVEEVEVK